MTQQFSKLVESLEAQEILDEFPEIISIQKRPNSHSSSSSEKENSDAVFSGHDEEQIKLMNENCIVLNWNDEAVGAGTKKTCHLMKNIEKGLLHRAFSVFIFNDDGELLLQQRASEKITFPDLWTNTCCSHPLCIDSEIGMKKTLESKVDGARTAAIRKLEQELGIPQQQTKKRGIFHFLNRIHYMAPSNEPWGEHEIDYIFFYKLNKGQMLTVEPNLNEVQNYKWVNRSALEKMLRDPDLKFTPWFKLIYESYLLKWWEEINELSNVENDRRIHRLL